MKSIIIFDTTLRDGEQSPGASFTIKDKVAIALQLESLGVDIIEAGFAISSLDDFKAISLISKKVKNAAVCSLSRAIDKDIERAYEAVKYAAHPMIHTFIGTSPLHVKYILKKTPREVETMAVEAVKKARKFVKNVEFSPMDASRTDIPYLARVVQSAIDAGATTINIPDTVGYMLPSIWEDFILRLIKRCPRLKEDIVLSVHCHNDLGLATANALAAVEAGARQVECTINGLGERGGNTSLEEVVMAIKMHRQYFGASARIHTREIYKTSRMVEERSGIPVQPNKAIVGRNAFSHESGIHQDGVLKKRETFEIMRAEDVGWVSNRLVLGKLSGRHAVSTRLKALGIRLNDKELARYFEEFKKLADKKGDIGDRDLRLIKSKIKNKNAK